jgi:hypothetical protein
VPPRTARVGLGSPLCWFRAGLVLVQIAMGAMTRPGEYASRMISHLPALASRPG